MVEQRSPKPRVESSSLSAPAKRSHDVVMASFFAPVAPLLRQMPAQQATGGGKMPELCGETAFDTRCSGVSSILNRKKRKILCGNKVDCLSKWCYAIPCISRKGKSPRNGTIFQPAQVQGAPALEGDSGRKGYPFPVSTQLKRWVFRMGRRPARRRLPLIRRGCGPAGAVPRARCGQRTA